MSIDYSNGTANFDKDNNIHYGVINQLEVLQAWADSSEPYCPEEEEENFDASTFTYAEDGYIAEAGEDGDIFILKSPYFTYCGFCSPCAPGAGYLLDPGEVKSYCFGPDWFDSEVAPYKVYSVETGKEVLE